MKRKTLSLVVVLSSVTGLIMPAHGLAAQQTYPTYTPGTTYYQQDFSSFTPVYNENASNVAKANSAGTTFEVVDGAVKATRITTGTDSSNPELNLKLDLGQTISSGKVAISADIKFSKVTVDGETDQAYLTIGQLFNPLIFDYQAKINGSGYYLTTRDLGWDEYHTYTVIADLDTQKETLYINGVQQTNVTDIAMHSNYASGISDLLIKLPRANAKCIAYIDNILVQEVADPLDSFDPCGDGSKYITEDLLSTISVDGSTVNVTYSDASGIVASDGTVTLPTNYTDVTVMASAAIAGVTYTKALSLTATPVSATTLLNAGFGAAPNATEQVFGSSAIDGWTAANAAAQTNASFAIGVPAAGAGNALHAVRNANTSSISNLNLSSSSFAAPSNITVVKFSVYKPSAKSMDIQITPYIGQITYGYWNSDWRFEIKPRGSSAFTTLSPAAMQTGRNDFMFVIDTLANKMDVYLNGICLTASGALTVSAADINADITAIGMTCQRNRNHSVSTDVYVDNLLVQSLDSNIRYAINGFTVENNQVTKVNISKYIGADEDLTLYIATYDSYGRMLNVTSQTLSNSALTGSSDDVTVTAPIGVSAGETIGAFIFSNDGKVIPYANAKRVIQ